MGAPDPAVEEPLKGLIAPKHTLLLVVHVQEIQRSRVFCELPAPGAQKASQHGSAKRVEEKDHTRPGREREIRGVSAMHAHRHASSTCAAPRGKISSRDARQRGMQLNACYGAKRIGGSQQQGTPHAGAEIDKSVLIDRRQGPALTPADDHPLKDGWRDGVVGGYMAIMAMPGTEMPPRNEAAGSNTEFQVEGVTDQTVFLRQPRKAPLAGSGLRGFNIARCANAHA